MHSLGRWLAAARDSDIVVRFTDGVITACASLVYIYIYTFMYVEEFMECRRRRQCAGGGGDVDVNRVRYIRNCIIVQSQYIYIYIYPYIHCSRSRRFVVIRVRTHACVIKDAYHILPMPCSRDRKTSGTIRCYWKYEMNERKI